MHSTKIFWTTTTHLALFGVQQWIKQRESCSHEASSTTNQLGWVISPCLASVFLIWKMGRSMPNCIGLSSSHILWLHKKHFFSYSFKIQSGHELWWMLLAAPPQINYFYPSLIRPFLQHDSQPIKLQNFRGTQQRNSDPATQICHLLGQIKLHAWSKVAISGFKIMWSWAQTSCSTVLFYHWNYHL